MDWKRLRCSESQTDIVKKLKHVRRTKLADNYILRRTPRALNIKTQRYRWDNRSTQTKNFLLRKALKIKSRWQMKKPKEKQ